MYFVTTNTWERRKLFLKANLAELVVAKILKYRDDGFYRIHRFVVMPDHMHLIVTPGTTTTLEKALGFLKGGSSFDIGKAVAMKFPVWQEGFAEHQIAGPDDFEAHVRYIDMNPVKAGLVEDPGEYRYCSLDAKCRLDPWPIVSGAKAPQVRAMLRRG
jgi:putative transposase